MNLSEAIFFPILSMLTIFLLTKLMGYRQITQLSLYDYIIGITIGSIASELAVSSFKDYFQPLLAMIIFGFGTWMFSYLTRISRNIRNVVEGKAIIIFEKGQINCQALKISKLDIDEFLMICRVNGYFDLEDIDRIILETNGRFSFFPKTYARPAQYGDLNQKKVMEKMPLVLIKEGQILFDNLIKTGHDKGWLLSQLNIKQYQLCNIELMYIDLKGKPQFYLKNNKKSYLI